MERKKDNGIRALLAGTLLLLGCTKVSPPHEEPISEVQIQSDETLILTPESYLSRVRGALEFIEPLDLEIVRLQKGVISREGVPVTENTTQSGVVGYLKKGEKITWIAVLDIKNKDRVTVERLGLLYPPEIKNVVTGSRKNWYIFSPSWSSIYMKANNEDEYSEYSTRPLFVLLSQGQNEFVENISYTSYPDNEEEVRYLGPNSEVRSPLNLTTICLPYDPRLPDFLGKDSPEFSWPTTGPLFTYFSEWHRGLDIGARFGSPVFATRGGFVSATENQAWGLGTHIGLKHDNSWKSVYGHLSVISVKPGEKVSKGDLIGCVGSTGQSTGPHLHFELHQSDEPKNPLNYLP